MANEPIYLGLPGSQVELAYPDGRPETPEQRGRIIEMHNGSLHAHYQGSFGSWNITWTDLTTAKKDEIETEVERLAELSFVIGSTSYPVFVVIGSWNADPKAGTGTTGKLWDCRLGLRQSS
jgi:hypothetical protein